MTLGLFCWGKKNNLKMCLHGVVMRSCAMKSRKIKVKADCIRKLKNAASEDALQGGKASRHVRIQCQLHFLSHEVPSFDQFLKHKSLPDKAARQQVSSLSFRTLPLSCDITMTECEGEVSIDDAIAMFTFLKGSYDAISSFPFSLECYKLFVHRWDPWSCKD